MVLMQVQEQAKAFLQKPEDHMQGLNLINSTNLDYFSPQHQAEMLNLKAQFFAALGDSDAGAWPYQSARSACCLGAGTHHSPGAHLMAPSSTCSPQHVQRGLNVVATVLGGLDDLGQVL